MSVGGGGMHGQTAGSAGAGAALSHGSGGVAPHTFPTASRPSGSGRTHPIGTPTVEGTPRPGSGAGPERPFSRSRGFLVRGTELCVRSTECPMILCVQFRGRRQAERVCAVARRAGQASTRGDVSVPKGFQTPRINPASPTLSNRSASGDSDRTAGSTGRPFTASTPFTPRTLAAGESF
jgi:hypothetical protein